MKEETQPDSIVGRYELQGIFGVSRQGIASIIDHPDFPPPICSVGKTLSPLFYRRDVEVFAEERRRAAAPGLAAH